MLEHKGLYFVVVYAPADTKAADPGRQEFWRKLNDTIGSLGSGSLIVLGDFNAGHEQYGSRGNLNVFFLLDLLNKHKLQLVDTDPTWTHQVNGRQRTLDRILYRGCRVRDVQVVDPEDVHTDHKLLTISVEHSGKRWWMPASKEDVWLQATSNIKKKLTEEEALSLKLATAKSPLEQLNVFWSWRKQEKKHQKEELQIEGTHTDVQAADKIARVFKAIWASEDPRKAPKPKGCPRAFSEEELCEALKEMNKKASPGPDHICVMDWLESPELEKTALLQMINRIICGEVEMPRSWRYSKTIPIPKKTNPCPPEQTRPISITSFGPKLVAVCLLKRMSRVIDRSLLTCQYGFRKKICPLKAVKDALKTLEAKPQAFMLSTDLAKAFDSVRHPLMFKLLEELSEELAATTYRLYDGAATQLVYKKEKRTVPLQRGVRQGDPLSAAIFNIVMAYVIKRLPSGAHPFVVADDMVVIAEEEGIVLQAVESIRALEEETGLRLQPAKCAIMAIRTKWRGDTGGIPLAKKIKFMGITIDDDLTFQMECQCRIDKAEEAVLQLRRSLEDFSKCNVVLLPKALLLIHQALVKTHLTYGRGVIPWTQQQQHKLDVAYLESVRCCFPNTRIANMEPKEVGAWIEDCLRDKAPTLRTLQVEALLRAAYRKGHKARLEEKRVKKRGKEALELILAMRRHMAQQATASTTPPPPPLTTSITQQAPALLMEAAPTTTQTPPTTPQQPPLTLAEDPRLPAEDPPKSPVRSSHKSVVYPTQPSHKSVVCPTQPPHSVAVSSTQPPHTSDVCPKQAVHTPTHVVEAPPQPPVRVRRNAIMAHHQPPVSPATPPPPPRTSTRTASVPSIHEALTLQDTEVSSPPRPEVTVVLDTSGVRMSTSAQHTSILDVPPSVDEKKRREEWVEEIEKKKLTCPLCPNKGPFMRKDKVDTHLKTQHNLPPTPAFLLECLVCGRKGLSKMSYVHHQCRRSRRSHQSVPEVPQEVPEEVPEGPKQVAKVPLECLKKCQSWP